MVFPHCFFEGVMVARFEVDKKWLLIHICQELFITLGVVALEELGFRLKQNRHLEIT